MFKLQIGTDNAAFGESPELELARILRHVATALERGRPDPGMIRDHNGNTVGHWVWQNRPEGA